MATIKKTITGLKPATNYLFSLKPKNTEISAIDAIPDTIRVQTPGVASSPSSITGVLLAANFKSAMLRFNHASMVDLDYYEYKIYLANDVTETALKARASTTTDGAMVSGITKSNLVVISDLDNTTLTGASPTPVSYKAKVRAVNTAGNAGAFSSASASATTQLIESQFIQDLTAAKITAGTIGAHEIVLTQSGAQTTITPPATTAIIRSSDYNGSYNPTTGVWTSGTAGWIIRGDGTAEFGAASIRDTLSANSIFINANNRWARNSTNSAGSSQFVVGDGTNQLSFDPTGGATGQSLFKVGNNTNFIKVDNGNLTVTGAITTNATISGSTAGGLTIGTDSIQFGLGGYASSIFFAGRNAGVDKFSIGSKLVYDSSVGGGTLTIDGTVTIGSTAASTVVSGAANGATAVQPVNVKDNIGGTGITTISGGVITSGTINLTNGVNIQTSGNTARINITSAGFFAYNGVGTPTVSINAADGSATFTGTVSASTISGSTFNSTNNLFKVDSSGNGFMNNIYATGATGANDGGIQIRADGGSSGASNGNIFIYHGRPSGATTYSIRLGGPTAVDINGQPINYKYFSVNQLIGQPSGPANVTRIQSSENAIQIDASNTGIGGRPSSNRTLMVHGDIILGEGNDDYDIISKNFSGTRTSGSVVARIDDSATAGYRYLADPGSLRELKENIQDISSEEAFNIIKTLRPRKFTWKPSPEDTEYTTQLRRMDIDYGFIAEEIEESNKQLSTYRVSDELAQAWPNITDEMVNNMKLRYYKSETLVPLTMKVVQGLIERVEYLETQLAAK